MAETHTCRDFSGVFLLNLYAFFASFEIFLGLYNFTYTHAIPVVTSAIDVFHVATPPI